MTQTSTRSRSSSRSVMLSWASYDWASSGFAVVIQTFVFAAYFTRQVAADETVGTHLWGNTLGIAGLIVALGGPIIGSIADCGGRRKVWLAFFLACCALATALLWFIQPAPSFVWPAMVLIVIGTIAEEYSYIFYNSMLPALAPPGQIGRWSGWGWSLGYFGGTACLLCALAVYTAASNSWIVLDEALAEPVRLIFPLTALWMVVFSLPLFLRVPDTAQASGPLREAIPAGLRQFAQTFRELRRHANLARFLVARTIFVDGIATLFAFGGIYAAGTFDMSQQAILLFGLALNVAAGVGAATFAWVDDWIGGKQTLLLALGGLMLSCIAILLVKSQTLFWVFGILIGVFIGPSQATSRSLVARMAPADLQTQMFGFFAVSGKATAFMGPLAVGWVTFWTSSQRFGMASVLVFFIVGALILLGVKEVKPSSSGGAA